MRAAPASLMIAALCTTTVVTDEAAPLRAPVPRVALPLTIEKLWLRMDGKRREGYLTIDDGGFEFFTKKRSFEIPLDRIHFINFGTTSWDVDTEWIVLSVGVVPPYDLIGLRDGAKWGFGGRTEELYHDIRRVLRQLEAAQFRVPAGFELYEDPGRACVLAIPQGWSTYLESLVITNAHPGQGTTVLSERPIRRTAEGRGEPAYDDLELLDAILAGESLGFLFERSQAGRGMGCEGFSKGGRERVLERARGDLVIGAGSATLAPPEVSPVTIGSCEGLRVLQRSRRPDGAEVVLELHAVAHGETLYTFGLRALADRYEAFRKPYLATLASVEFGAEISP